MPLIQSNYRPHPLLPGGFLQTVLPSQFCFLPLPRYSRERIGTSDGDFLDLDWLRGAHARLVILSHGLEGSSSSSYIRSSAACFAAAGWDVLAWNMRGCSGEPNFLPQWYHSGKSEDLALVVAHACTRYQQLALLGFSVGGNITLKYLAEQGARASGQVAAAACFSVPCDLAGSADALAQPHNALYMRHFIRLLCAKLHTKATRFPELRQLAGKTRMRNFHDFDGRITAPLNGFASAQHYWSACSSLPLLAQIRVPTLLLSASNDSFLSPSCYPRSVAESSPFLSLEQPAQGGHMGFPTYRAGGHWVARRALRFLRETLKVD